MIITQPSYRSAAAGALFDPNTTNLQRIAPLGASTAPIYATAAPSSSSGFLAGLQAKWAALSTVGKVAVAGGGAVALVLVFSAMGKKR